MIDDIKCFLDKAAEAFNQPEFIENDPISLPHLFTKKEDIEIIGFWVAMLAWGQRKTIINKGKELIALMDGAPHEFIVNHREIDRKKFLSFKHRTFQATDTLYFLEFLQQFYQKNSSLESAFSDSISENDLTVEKGLIHFHNLFFALPDAPKRTRKHIATPARKSTCKRLNMFLRWMVRKDDRGVDFGIWQQIKPRQLLIPLDVHVDRVARRMGLLHRKQTDWKSVLELTSRLREFNSEDPAIYDFALFGTGLMDKKKPTT